MRKIIASLLACFLMLSLLCGCHGNQSLAEFEIPDEFDTSREYEITFWAKNDNNSEQVAIYENAVAEFEKLYPNIHITIKKYSDYKVIYNDVITNIPTQTTPNICITYPDHIATYKTGENVVVPLDDLIADEEYGLGGSKLLFDGVTKDEIITKFFEEGQLDGVTYDLPFMRSTECLYINKTYVEAMGFEIPDIPTWDWVWEVATAATEKNEDGTYKVNGQKVMIPFIYKSTDNMMITAAYQMGSGYSTEDGEVLLFNESTKNFLKKVYEQTVNGSFSTFKISSYPGNYINAGQCIFGIDSTAGATWMGSGAGHQDISEEKIVQFETVVRPVPQMDTENPLMISQGPSICIFNKQDNQEVLASWLFAQYLLTNDTQIAYSQTEGYVPVTTKAQETEEYQDYLSRSGEDNDMYYHVKIEATQLLLDNIDNTFVTPVFNGSASLREAAGEIIESTVKGGRRKDDTSGDYYEEIFSKASSLYKLDQMGDSVSGKKDLGELPVTSVILLSSIGAVWVLIAIYILLKYNKRVSKK